MPQPLEAPEAPATFELIIGADFQASSTAVEEVTFEQFVTEHGIPLAQARHVAAEHELTMASKGTAKEFADLVDATNKARV